MQCQSKEKGPRYSPGELNPGDKANKVRVGLVRCRRLKVNKNEALEAMADKVEDDNDAIPVDETKSTAKPIPTRKRHFDPYDKDSEPNPESDEPEFKPGAKVLIHNPKTKHWDRSAIVINWRHGRTYVLDDGTQRVTRRALRPGERCHNNHFITPPNAHYAGKDAPDTPYANQDTSQVKV